MGAGLELGLELGLVPMGMNEALQKEHGVKPSALERQARSSSVQDPDTHSFNADLPTSYLGLDKPRPGNNHRHHLERRCILDLELSTFRASIMCWTSSHTLRPHPHLIESSG